MAGSNHGKYSQSSILDLARPVELDIDDLFCERAFVLISFVYLDIFRRTENINTEHNTSSTENINISFSIENIDIRT
jgi:hypothetical protein